MTMWLLNEATLREIRAAREKGVAPTAENMTMFGGVVEAAKAGRHDCPENLVIAGDVAEIRIEGVLVNDLDFWLWFIGFKQTTYHDIQRAISMAETDPEVRSIRFFVDSPGGEVDGLFDTLGAIDRMRSGSMDVSVRAVTAYSAAFALAAAAGPIEAQNAASGFGSIGVAASFFVSEHVIDVTNTESPDKRPDVTTEEGRAVVVSHLDDIFALFAEAIAKGRETTVKDVTDNFGRGALLLAGEAMRRGMIDSIAAPALRVVPSTAAAVEENHRSAVEDGATTENPMNERELRAQHPDLYEAVMKAGVTKERDRVSAHLTMGAQSGDLETAHTAIREGSEMTQEMTARYMAAGMRRATQDARQVDSDTAGAVVDGAPSAGAAAPENDFDATVVAELERRRGPRPDPKKKD